MTNEPNAESKKKAGESNPPQPAPEVLVQKEGSLKQGKESGEPEQPTETRNTPAQPPIIPPIVVQVSQPEGPAGDRIKWTDIAIVILTAGIVLTAIIQACIFTKQWKEMHAAGEQTDKLIRTANEIKSALIVANQQNLDAVNRTLKASQENADASNKQSYKALDTTIESFHLDQRPWAYMSQYVLSGEPEENKEFTIKIGMFNSGKTPAFDVTPKSQVFNYNVEPPETDFTKAPEAKSRGLVPPGITEISFTTDPMKIVGPSLSAYNNGINSIYVHARIDYVDAFKMPHWTTICIFHIHGRPLSEFQYCERGNDADSYTKRPN
ncbi:MAG: hypothetical protein LAN36_13700 [Acidobacteriia bacterium]|nr:hypothetical protein [Terriglobia bacterium]